MKNEKIKQYLLGSLAEGEMREMDLQVISDASLEESLLAAEDELMDDYLDGILSPPDEKLFLENFLASGERRAALRDLDLLKRYARNVAAKPYEKKSVENGAGSWLGNLKSIFMLNLSPAKAFGALLLLCATIGIGWSLVFYDSGKGDQAQQESVRLNGKDLSDLTRFENIQTVSLVSGSFRNSGTAQRLSANRLENHALFRLVLPVKADRGTAFDVRLARGGNDVLTLEQVRSYENQSGQELRVLVPASLLGKGDYRIEVTGDPLTSPVVYSFTIH